MPSRPGLLLMYAGGIALLVAVFLLWRSTRSESAPLATHAAEVDEAPAQAGTPAPPGSPAARPGKRMTIGGITITRGRASDSGPAPSVEPTIDDAPPGSMANKKNLHYGGTQLRAQAKAVEPLVRECVDKEAAAGLHPSGNALLTYVVAKHGDKYEVEDTSYDPEQTTLQQESLITCLSETAKAMKFVGLPREAEALVVTRSVKIENGAVTEYKHVGFSYLR